MSSKKLLITNGDVAADLFQSAGVDAGILPWQDCLHLGPVPVADNDEDFISLRAAFLADGDLHSVDDIIEDMTKRNQHIMDHQNYQVIELWFEHDLYDQLQLIQILSMLHDQDRLDNIVLVQALTYLGMQTPESILKFKEFAIDVTPGMLERASKIWGAFRQDTPQALYDETLVKTDGFSVLRQALKRALQELPGPDGLSRTERQIIYSINRGITRTGMLFARVNAMEEATFMGDWGFFALLSNLAFCGSPLLTGLPEKFTPGVLQDTDRRKAFITSELRLTQLGSDVLTGVEDHAHHNVIDYWLGGIHLTNDNLWRWDDEKEELFKT